MEKPTLEQLQQALASGKGSSVKVIVHGVEIGGNTFWLADDGTVLDRFIVVRDTPAGYVREERKSGWSKIVKRAREVGAAVLTAHKIPIAAKLLDKIGIRANVVAAILTVLKKKTKEEQLVAVMRLTSPRRWNNAYDLYLELKKDGLSTDDIKAITKIARGA